MVNYLYLIRCILGQPAICELRSNLQAQFSA